MEQSRWDGFFRPDGQWIDDGAAELAMEPEPAGHECPGCGGIVGWRWIEWRFEWQANGDDRAFARVEPVVPAWHPWCRRAAAAERLSAEWVAFRRLVPAIVGALQPIVGAAVPALAERSAALRDAGVPVVRLYLEATRRRIEAVRVERVIRPAAEGLGSVVASSLDVGARVARVAERGQFEFTDRAYLAGRLVRQVVWARRLGWTGAWRQLRDAEWLRQQRFGRLRRTPSGAPTEQAPAAGPQPVQVWGRVATSDADGRGGPAGASAAAGWQAIGWVDSTDFLDGLARWDREPAARRELLDGWAAERDGRDGPGRGHGRR